MPFVKVATNLARNQLPKSFMPKFNAQLAVILNKDEKVFKWQLETDKYMAVVSLVTAFASQIDTHLWLQIGC